MHLWQVFDKVLLNKTNLNCVILSENIQERKKNGRAHSELNQGPIDLQSIALPLSYTPVI